MASSLAEKFHKAYSGSLAREKIAKSHARACSLGVNWYPKKTFIKIASKTESPVFLPEIFYFFESITIVEKSAKSPPKKSPQLWYMPVN